MASILYQRGLRSLAWTCRRYLDVTAVRLVADDVKDVSKLADKAELDRLYVTTERPAGYDTELELWVPKKDVGSYGGRERRHSLIVHQLQSLQLSSGTSIIFNKRLQKDGLVPFSIRGPDIENCTQAKEALEKLFTNRSETRISLPVPEGNFAPVPTRKEINTLLLKRFEQCGVHQTPVIIINKIKKDGLASIIIQGPPENWDKAKEIIEQVFASRSETTVWVAEEKIAQISGRGGKNIKTVEQATGTRIRFSRSLKKDGLVPVTITGPPEKHIAAKEAIEEIEATNNHPDNFSVNQSELTIWVQAGAIDQSILQNIKKKSRCTSIRIDNAKAVDGLVPVRIRGLNEISRQDASDMIGNIVDVRMLPV